MHGPKIEHRSLYFKKLRLNIAKNLKKKTFLGKHRVKKFRKASALGSKMDLSQWSGLVTCNKLRHSPDKDTEEQLYSGTGTD